MDANLDEWPYLTAWETAQFCGIDLPTLLGMAEDGAFPQPCSTWPLRWNENDAGRWWLARQTEGQSE